MALHRARGRRAAGRTLVEGPGPAGAALAAGIAPSTWFTLEADETARRAEAAGAAVLVVTPEILRRVATSEHPRGPVAVVEIPAPAPLRAGPTLVLAGIADPGNAGALLRSAAAFGYDVAVLPGGVDPWAPKTVRAAAGAHFALRLSRIVEVHELRSAGLRLVGAVPRGGIPPEAVDAAGPIAIVVGSEAHGLPDELLSTLDTLVTVPTTGRVESLNAAIAGSLLMYLLARGRLDDG